MKVRKRLLDAHLAPGSRLRRRRRHGPRRCPGRARRNARAWHAGIFFDLTGAAVSHAAVRDAAGKVTTPLVLLAVAMGSWALHPRDRVLAGHEEPKNVAPCPRAAFAL